MRTLNRPPRIEAEELLQETTLQAVRTWQLLQAHLGERMHHERSGAFPFDILTRQKLAAVTRLNPSHLDRTLDHLVETFAEADDHDPNLPLFRFVKLTGSRSELREIAEEHATAAADLVFGPTKGSKAGSITGSGTGSITGSIAGSEKIQEQDRNGDRIDPDIDPDIDPEAIQLVESRRFTLYLIESPKMLEWLDLYTERRVRESRGETIADAPSTEHDAAHNANTTQTNIRHETPTRVLRDADYRAQSPRDLDRVASRPLDSIPDEEPDNPKEDKAAWKKLLEATRQAIEDRFPSRKAVSDLLEMAKPAHQRGSTPDALRGEHRFAAAIAEMIRVEPSGHCPSEQDRTAYALAYVIQSRNSRGSRLAHLAAKIGPQDSPPKGEVLQQAFAYLSAAEKAKKEKAKKQAAKDAAQAEKQRQAELLTRLAALSQEDTDALTERVIENAPDFHRKRIRKELNNGGLSETSEAFIRNGINELITGANATI